MNDQPYPKANQFKLKEPELKVVVSYCDDIRVINKLLLHVNNILDINKLKILFFYLMIWFIGHMHVSQCTPKACWSK